MKSSGARARDYLAEGVAALLLLATLAGVRWATPVPIAVAALAVPLRWAASRSTKSRLFGVGIANFVTLARHGIVVLALVGTSSPSIIGGLALLAFALDGLDGALARRFGEVDSAGSILDMEVDAYATLAFTFLLSQRGGAFLLLLVPGTLRYVYVLARFAAKVEEREALGPVERRSSLGRLFYFAFMTTLVVSFLPVPGLVRNAALFASGLGICVSFATDFGTLSRASVALPYLLGGVALLDIMLFWPLAWLLDKPELLDLPHLATELLLLVAFVVVLGGRVARAGARIIAPLAYVSLLVFLLYHAGFVYFFRRPAAVVEDVRLLVHLGHFLATSPISLAAALLLALAIHASFRIARAIFVGLGSWGERMPPRRGRALAALLSVVALVPLSITGTSRDAPFVQPVSRFVRENARASRARIESQRVLAESPADRRYVPFLEPMLRERPNVHLFMVEAYGEVLATSDMREPYVAILSDLERRLTARGYRSATAYSVSPVHGGSSWFAISTTQTGVHIAAPSDYALLEKGGRTPPSLTSFFSAQGYRTMTLQPGNSDRAGLRQYDLFARDVVVEKPELGYEGPSIGWGVVPDQYSIGFFRDRFLASAASPRFVFMMTVSTHFPWDEVPRRVADYRSLNQKGAEDGPTGDPVPGEAAVDGEQARRYLRAVHYDLSLLVDYVEAEGEQAGVFFVLGDHQPHLPSAKGSDRTPLHVIARDERLLRRFIDRGFAPGLLGAEPGPPLKHEGLFSLIASELVAVYGEGKSLPYFPEGLGVSALKR